MSGWWLKWDTWHTPERFDQGGCTEGVVTLHSGQSSPSTPTLPCSTTGTGPVEKKRKTVRMSVCIIWNSTVKAFLYCVSSLSGDRERSEAKSLFCFYIFVSAITSVTPQLLLISLLLLMGTDHTSAFI